MSIILKVLRKAKYHHSMDHLYIHFLSVSKKNLIKVYLNSELSYVAAAVQRTHFKKLISFCLFSETNLYASETKTVFWFQATTPGFANMYVPFCSLLS